MQTEFTIAGFGGQGVLLMGQLLIHAGLLEDKNVVWFPSYGPEARGGESYCNVVVSTGVIGSPIVTEPDVLVIMNNLDVSMPDGSRTRMLTKLESTVKPGGLIVLNSTLVNEAPTRTDCRVVRIPATSAAEELGTQKAANVVMLGALVELTGAVAPEMVSKSFYETFPPERHKLIPLNEKALEAGRNLAKGKEL